MKKTILTLIMAGILILSLSGCTTSLSFTYNVETGDAIEVELNTTDGYKLDSDLPFTISKDDVEMSQGTFIKGEYYDQYVSVAENDPKSEILDRGEDDNITYVFYTYNDEEWNYVIKVKDSNTGLLIGNPHSKEEAETCFSLLTISKDGAE